MASRESAGLMMNSGGTAFKLGRQITQYLLCACCETRFSKNGEDYFADVAMQRPGQIPPVLLRVLSVNLNPFRHRIPYRRFSFGSGLFDGEGGKGIDSRSIYYFAISLFWRGGLDGWRFHQKVEYEDGLLDAMGRFLLGGDYVSGYIVRVIPSIFHYKWGFVLPNFRKGVPFFNIGSFDFYLERRSSRTLMRGAPFDVPIFYTIDIVESISSHLEMTGAIRSAKKTKVLDGKDDLISW